MNIPKNYFHTKSILLLLSINGALLLLSVLNVILSVDTSEAPTSVIAYRDTTLIGQITGPTSDLYQFALFACIATIGSVVLSLRLFARRRHVAIAVLNMNLLVLVLSIIVFNALTITL